MSATQQDLPTLTAVFEPAPEGGFTCTFEELPEVFSEGETLDEARANLFDALELVLSYHRDQNHRHSHSEAAVREVFALQRAG
jgi:predicted RNase H-like HicB family nuclease